MRITNLPWEIELWMCSLFWILILMTWLFWKEVIAGRYDPRFWDKDGDDDTLRDLDHDLDLTAEPAPHHNHIIIPLRGRKMGIYDLIDDEDGSGREERRRRRRRMG
jgi:hypothetical protein